jgi:hypothetical protein
MLEEDSRKMLEEASRKMLTKKMLEETSRKMLEKTYIKILTKKCWNIYKMLTKNTRNVEEKMLGKMLKHF